MLSRLKTIIALMRNPKVSKLPKVLVVGAAREPKRDGAPKDSARRSAKL